LKKLTVAALAAIGLAACSNEAAAPTNEAGVVEANAAASADDDTLEPAAPQVEEGEEHNEEAPHSH
jgi:hypothetical protein